MSGSSSLSSTTSEDKMDPCFSNTSAKVTIVPPVSSACWSPMATLGVTVVVVGGVIVVVVVVDAEVICSVAVATFPS